MSIQQAIHITLCIPYTIQQYHFNHMLTTRQSTCIITTKKKLCLSPNSTEFHCKSLVDKCINPNERLNDLCLAKFVINYDIKVNKKRFKSKIICWVSFNQHKNLKNHYKKIISI